MKSSPDSGRSSSSSQIPTRSPQQRRGKWSAEEEIYALAAIHDFNAGCLDAPAGITLRGYLSDRLQCDPMRITKKFHGDASIGKKVIRSICKIFILMHNIRCTKFYFRITST